LGQRCKKAEEQNLIDATHYLLNSQTGADDVQEDLLFLKASEQVLHHYDKQQKDDEFLVLPENWDAVNLFNNCSTQWQHYHNGAISGLDYSGVLVVIKIMKLKHKKKLFKKLQVMEQIALSAH